MPLMIKPDFKGGLLPVIVQDARTLEVLMFAHMDEEALRLTLETGLAHYFSRSRQKLWKKGEESGHFQHVKEARIDCDEDCLLLLVEQDTAHAIQVTGRASTGASMAASSVKKSSTRPKSTTKVRIKI